MHSQPVLSKLLSARASGYLQCTVALASLNAEKIVNLQLPHGAYDSPGKRAGPVSRVGAHPGDSTNSCPKHEKAGNQGTGNKKSRQRRNRSRLSDPMIYDKRSGSAHGPVLATSRFGNFQRTSCLLCSLLTVSPSDFTNLDATIHSTSTKTEALPTTSTIPCLTTSTEILRNEHGSCRDRYSSRKRRKCLWYHRILPPADTQGEARRRTCGYRRHVRYIILSFPLIQRS